MDESISDLVAAALTDVGLPAQTCMILTMLIRDHRFAGHKFTYGGGYAVLWADGDTLDLYDDSGRWLKQVAVEMRKGVA